MSRVLLSPGPYQAFSCPRAFGLWSGVFLVAARTLSESGGRAALDLAGGGGQRLWMSIAGRSSGDD